MKETEKEYGFEYQIFIKKENVNEDIKLRIKNKDEIASNVDLYATSLFKINDNEVTHKEMSVIRIINKAI